MLRSHRFLLLSAVVAVAVVAILLFTYRTLTMNSLVSQEERASTTLASVLANAILPENQQFLETTEHLGNDELRYSDSITRLNGVVNNFIYGTNILKVQIIDARGRVLYSSNPAQIGDSKASSPGFQQAMTGVPASQFSFRDSFTGAHAVYSNLNVVATYIPVRHLNDEALFGAFEIYSDVTDLVASLERTQIRIIAIVIAAMLVIYTILFMVSRRADAIHNQQNEERIHHEARLRFHTHHDPVTGLQNRAGLFEQLRGILEIAGRDNRLVGVLSLDLDRFKLVNDSMGHGAGDDILGIVARRLQKVIRDSDQLFRLGGDEFAIVPEPIDTSERLANLAERVIAAMRLPIEYKAQQIVITASVGISVYPRDDHDAEKLVKNAEAAMYLAKQQGRNQFSFYTPDLNARASEQLAYESALAQALGNNEFVLFYQPRVENSSGRIVGMEALLRWQRATGELVPPIRFVPILEDRELIIEVGEWVLNTAARQIQSWLASGYHPGRVSVNVSPRQFHRENFVEVVRRCIATTGIDPDYLELELTEGVLLDNSQRTIHVMQELKQLGVKLSIDDFGSGYSSLNYLKLLPIDYLKIDRSFIKDVTTSEKDVAIVNTITTLANELRIGVVAEGVEQDDQWRFLQSRYCQELQGFLFSRPVEARRIEEILEQQREAHSALPVAARLA